MSESSSQYTIVPVLLVSACVLWFAALLFPALGSARPNRSDMKNLSHFRGIAQSSIIFGNSNNDHFPGLSSNGEILTGPAVQAHGNAQTGASFHARLWVLTNGQFVGGDLLIAPYNDTLTKWVSGQNCTSLNTSYAGLQIGDDSAALTTANNDGRAAEWKNNANSQAIMFGDRLLVPTDTEDSAVQSIWTTTTGNWKGSVVWGDVHGGIEQSQKGFTTRYLAATNTNDNLFITQGTPTATENPTVDAKANAMLIYY